MARRGLSGRGALLVIILVTVLIRAIAAIALGDSALPVSGAYDQVSYDALAQRLVSGNGFSFGTDSYPFVKANEPTAHWSFLYTLYLAGVYVLFGHHPLAARLIQVLLASLNIVLVHRLGQRLFGERVGLIAAVLTGGYAYLIFFNAALMTQTIYIMALLFALDTALALADDPASQTLHLSSFRRWLLLGVALGIGTLMRQTLLLFSPVLFAYIWWRRRHAQQQASTGGQQMRWTESRSLLASFAIFLVPLAVIAAFVLPWTVRNYLIYHDFMLLNSNSGFWFYSSNHPNQGTSFDQTYVAPIPAELEGLNEPAIDRALFREAIGFVVSDPVRFILLSINRTKDYFWLVPSDQSSLISNLSRLFSFTLYLPFMLSGLWLSRRQWRICLPLYLYVTFDAALCLASWSAPRYRLPSDAIMMVFAGLAVVALVDRIGVSRLMRLFPEPLTRAIRGHI